MQRWTRVKLVKTIFLCLLSTLLICQPAVALNKERLDKWAANNILFYDPDECDDAENATKTCTAKPEGKDITWIGDSYTEGAKQKIQDKMSGVDIHSQGSKQFGQGSDTNQGGLAILKDLKDDNKVRKYVVMALGTNQDASGADKDSSTKLFDEMVSTGGDDKTYILMTAFTKNSNDGKANYDDFNEAVKEYAKNNSNILVADWESAAKDKVDEFFASDAIHPSSGDGYQTFVDTFYNALPGGCGAGKLAGDTNAEKVWNYFVDANIDGISDNAAVISGIIGNLMQESGVNPFSTNGKNYGVYQEENTAMKDKVDSAVGGNYWGKSDAPEDAVSTALSIELDFLVQENIRFKGEGWAANFGFIKVLDKVSSDTPEAYSDLWLVTVEGAVTSNKIDNNYIEDAGARSIGTANFSSADGGGEYYQEAGNRRNYARTTYDTYANGGGSSSDSDDTTAYSAPKTNNLLADKPSSFPSIEKSALMSTNTYTWEDGWLTGGVPGIEKEDVTNASDLDEHPKEYETADGKPNKIILHNTQGTGAGYAAYPSGNKYPAHFIVDLKKQIGYQNFPITTTAAATRTGDSSSVQIEIVGFSTDPSSDYYLQSFSATEWDYLAVLLAAISQETGIPLTTSMDWDDSKPIRYTGTKEEFRDNITGIVGHMHTPAPDDHVDPGNIWSQVEAAISRNPTASQFGGTGKTETTACPDEGGDDEQTTTVDGKTLAEMAVSMAWPVQEDGTCKNASGDDVSWSSNKEDCYLTPRDKYQTMYDKYSMSGDLADCGHFVATVVHAAEVDSDFPKGGSDNMGSHMDGSDKWEKVSASSESDLEPGDIMWYNGHIEMYVGDYGGSYGKIASASMSNPKYVGIMKDFRIERKGETATVYRLVAQTSSTLKSGGMSKEDADAFMAGYSAESDKMATGDFMYDGALVTDAGCPSGTMNNCSAFTQWFLNRYTTMGPSGATRWQGSLAVKNYLADNSELIDGGKVPKVYAIVSMGPGTGSADGWPNHTGIVLGINEEADEIIIGEASCGSSNGKRIYPPHAEIYSLSQYTNSTSQYGPTYAYTDNILKGDL